MGPFYRFFGGPPLWVILRLVVLSLVVGIVLSVLGIRPFEIWDAVRAFFEYLWYEGYDAIRDIADYFIIGAIIVIPIWLVLRLLKVGSGRP